MKNDVCRNAGWVVMVLIAMALGTTTANAQTAKFVEYSSKFLCGTAKTSTMVTPGTYMTSINIHNPALIGNGQTVSFQKKAVFSIQEPPTGGTLPPPSSFVTDQLPPDFSEEVDCTVIRALLGPIAPPAPAFIEGWVVLYVPPTGSTTNQLDVEGVYTNKTTVFIHQAIEHMF